VLALGILRSQTVEIVSSSANEGYIGIGGSLLTHLLERLLRPDLPPGSELLADPVFFAGWLGLLATTMNLIPAGQLDGGHVLYALHRSWHRQASIGSGVVLAAIVTAYALSGQFSVWTLWCVIVLTLMRRHPVVLDDGRPLGVLRIVLALVAAVILVICFMPHPLALP